MKILITGGHVTPAISLIQYLKKNFRTNIYFIARDNVFEKKLLEENHINYSILKSGKINRSLSFSVFKEFFLFFNGFLESYKILKKECPDFIFSFGGFIAFPITVMGFLLKIPIYTHEQTISPGLTNKAISFFAKKIFISFAETAKYFPKNKVVYSGNPLRSEIIEKKIERSKLQISKNKPVIFITGGSQGSHSINVLIENCLNELLEKYIIIHQTGDAKEFNDFDRLSKNFKSKNYFIYKNLLSDEQSEAYNISDLVISRSGANTVFELIYLSKPSILIPLPWSANGEQRKHAEYLNKLGVAEIFDQNDQSNLLILINKTIGSLDRYKNNFEKLNNPIKENPNKIISQNLPLNEK